MGHAHSSKNKNTGSSTQPESEIEDYTNEIMCGTDKLYEVKQNEMNEKLHKNIVAIVWKNSFGLVGRGSGLLVSPNLVLTCAHNLYNDRFERVEEEYFRIYPGQHGSLGAAYRV